jgi:hypothetical protein
MAGSPFFPFPAGLYEKLTTNGCFKNSSKLKSPLLWAKTASVPCRDAALGCLVNFAEASSALLRPPSVAAPAPAPAPPATASGKAEREGERLFAFAMAMCQSSGEDLYALCVQTRVLRACQDLAAEHGDEYAEDLAVQQLRALTIYCPWLRMRLGSSTTSERWRRTCLILSDITFRGRLFGTTASADASPATGTTASARASAS